MIALTYINLRIASHEAVSFVDNHDIQRYNSGTELGGSITFFEPKLLKMATAFMLAWAYAIPR